LKILVVPAHNNASLNIVQTLGRIYKVSVLGMKGYFNKAFFSKFKYKSYVIENFNNQTIEKIINILIDISKDYDLIIPTNDVFSLIISKYKFLFGNKAIVMDYDKLLKFMDKSYISKFFKKYPKFYNENNVKFPAVVKSKSSYFLEDNKIIKGKLLIVNNDDELKNALKEVPYPIIQEKVEGKGWGIEILFNKEIILAFSHVRIREADPKGSYSSCAMSIPLNFEILREIENILKSLDYFGVGMVEMKGDYFIEFNPRFWGSLSLAIECGLNFPLYLIKTYLGEKIEKNYNYKIGVISRWLYSEIVHILKSRNYKLLFEIFKFNKYKSFNNEHIDPLPGLLELIVLPIRRIMGYEN